MLESLMSENHRSRTSLKRANSLRGGVAKLRVSRRRPSCQRWSLEPYGVVEDPEEWGQKTSLS